MRLLAALYALLLCPVLYGQQAEVPPPDPKHVWNRFDPAFVINFGCNIRQADGGRWYTRVYARHGNPGQHKDYELLLSVRDDEKGAMKDCRGWMDEARKRIKQARQEEK